MNIIYCFWTGDNIMTENRKNSINQLITNSIENYFSMLKSRLQKLDGLTHSCLKGKYNKSNKRNTKRKIHKYN